MTEGKSWCWKWSGNIFSLKDGLFNSHFENLVKGLGIPQWNGACPVHPQENRGFYMVLTLCCSCMCWGGVGWPLRRESCFSASVVGERPGWLRGSIESWHSPAVSVVFQPKLCTGDGVHGASPALGVRDVAAACHSHWAPPSCWDFTREARVGWDHGRLFVRLAEISQGHWRN